VHLLCEPTLRTSAERLRETNRHFRRDPRSAVQQRREVLPADPEAFGGLRDRKSQRFEAISANHFSWVRRIFHRHDRHLVVCHCQYWWWQCRRSTDADASSRETPHLVVVHEVHVCCVPGLKSEDNAPIAGHIHSPGDVSGHRRPPGLSGGTCSFDLRHHSASEACRFRLSMRLVSAPSRR